MDRPNGKGSKKESLLTALTAGDDGGEVFDYRTIATKEQLLKFEGLVVGMITLAELPPGKAEDFYCAYCINTLYDDEDEGKEKEEDDIEKGKAGDIEKPATVQEEKEKEKEKKKASKKKDTNVTPERAKYAVLWDFTAELPFCKGVLDNTPVAEERKHSVSTTYHVFHSECLGQQIKFWIKQRSRSQRINIRCPNGCRSVSLDPPYNLNGPGSEDGSEAESDDDDEYHYCSKWRVASFLLRAFACCLTAFMVWYYGWAQKSIGN